VGALKAAAHVARSVILVSAADAGIYAGPGWFAALIEAAHEAAPKARFSALLDCGDRPGAVLAAIRAQVEGAIFTGRDDVADRLADIARQHGVGFLTERPTGGLDLSDQFFATEAESQRCCADFLSRSGCL
jgi:hypothetical protein